MASNLSAEPSVASPTSDPPRARGSSLIATELRRAILDGAYGFAERLPAERELARIYGASRTAVRAALDRLAQGGLVTRKVGSGTFVSYRSERNLHDVAEITSPLELIDVRLAVEPAVVRLAVVNATVRELERPRRALAELCAVGDDAEAFSRWDEHFHLALAECTRNPLLVAISRQINHVRAHAQWSAMKDTILTPARIIDYNRQHRALFEAIQGRDANAAEDVILEHLAKARADLLGARAQ